MAVAAAIVMMVAVRTVPVCRSPAGAMVVAVTTTLSVVVVMAAAATAAAPAVPTAAPTAAAASAATSPRRHLRCRHHRRPYRRLQCGHRSHGRRSQPRSRRTGCPIRRLRPPMDRS